MEAIDGKGRKIDGRKLAEHQLRNALAGAEAHLETAAAVTERVGQSTGAAAVRNDRQIVLGEGFDTGPGAVDAQMPEGRKEIRHGLSTCYETGDIDFAMASVEVQSTDQIAAAYHRAAGELPDGQGAS